jgi:hypothetical protein
MLDGRLGSNSARGRDDALRRLVRLTLLAFVGAGVLTGLFTALAVHSFHGRTIARVVRAARAAVPRTTQSRPRVTPVVPARSVPTETVHAQTTAPATTVVQPPVQPPAPVQAPPVVQTSTS